MPYFLDGNNLIGLARRKARPGDDDRQALIAELNSRLRSTRATARLFFDGEGRAASYGSLTVSGAGGSADDAILRELSKTSDPGQVIVVTADRELGRRVRDAGGKTMAPVDFWKRMAPSETGGGKETKVNVDEWLDYFADPKNRKSDADS